MILKSQRCQWDHKEKLKTVSARISASLHSKQYNVLSRWGEHFLWFDFFSIMASEVFIFHNKVQGQGSKSYVTSWGRDFFSIIRFKIKGQRHMWPWGRDVSKSAKKKK
jgi:hypothetical protein